MPLLDHFHPPLDEERHWESFHTTWAGSIADALNRQLPENYFAEEQTHAGANPEIDVATFKGRRNGAGGTASPEWSPPPPRWTLAATFADDFQVQVIARRGGPRLVAAIELVSPRNKGRPEARRGFATKCASYLHQGIGLIIVDIVTDRRANLHNEIMQIMAQPAEYHLTVGGLYAVAYRPLRRDEREEIDLWPETFAVGGPMPVLPLAVTAELVLPVDLEATYMHACERRRLA